MNIYVVTALHLVHVLAGVAWAGSTFTLVGFDEPAAKAFGPQGEKFLERVMHHTAAVYAIPVAALSTSLTGLALLWWSSGGLQPSWLFSKIGLAFTIGSAAGLIDNLFRGSVTTY